MPKKVVCAACLPKTSVPPGDDGMQEATRSEVGRIVEIETVILGITAVQALLERNGPGTLGGVLLLDRAGRQVVVIATREQASREQNHRGQASTSDSIHDFPRIRFRFRTRTGTPWPVLSSCGQAKKPSGSSKRIVQVSSASYLPASDGTVALQRTDGEDLVNHRSIV